MKKIAEILAVVILFLLFGLAGYKANHKPQKEYTMRYPIKVIEATTEAPETETEIIITEMKKETETKKETVTETVQEEIKETVYEDATELYEPVTEEAEEVYVEDSNGSYLGYYELTAYTHTGNCMANGEYPYVGACACNSLDLGTVVYIEGYGTYTVCDRGGMSDNVIDIFMDTYDECVEFGRRSADVYLVE